MGFRGCTLVLVTALVCASLPFAADARELWERDWREIRTEHFIIASALPVERTAALAVELEHFRVVARLLILHGGSDPFEERIPTKIYMLPATGGVKGLIEQNYAGYFMNQMRANYAVMRESGNESDETLKHEYVHFLTHNYSAVLYPPWFDEGFAEVLSTLTVRDGIIEYGRANKVRMETLEYAPWMSFEKLLTTRQPRSLSLTQLGPYYAQSWLLMQYLMVGRDGHSFSTEVADFLRRLRSAEPTLPAFKAAFGLDPNELERTLRTYARKARYYRSATTFPLPAVEPKVRVLAVNEIAADLGLLALLRGSYKESEEFYAAALEAKPNNGIALAGMGDIHKHAKRFEEAERSYAAAVAAEPTNGNHELDWGEYFLQRANDEKDAAKRHDLLAEARRHFARSYAINPQNPETLDQNALTYLYPGEDVSKAVTSLEAAYDLLPSQPTIQRDLALAYINTGRAQPARELLSRLLAWVDNANTDALKKLLDELPPDPTAKDADGGASAK